MKRELINPTDPEVFASRDRLLTRALRSGGPTPPWEIAAEYPLVLGEDGARWSWCCVVDGSVVAHANLWPRELADVRVGLVGNVATATELRGQGVMREIMAELAGKAAGAGLEGLLLWSDLSEFYQKLGFKSSGRERRYVFGGKVAAAAGKAGGATWRCLESRAVAEADCARWLGARARMQVPSPTLARAPEEMRRLLQIPGVSVWESGASYAVIGRGSDMVGVVHEWAVGSPGELFGLLAAARARNKQPEIMLLAPAKLPAGWDEELTAPAEHVEDHPMAWTKVLATGARAAHVEKTLDEAFVWGLDSI